MRSSTFLLILIVMAATFVAVTVALIVAWRHRAAKPRAVPVCGGCGYQLAPNPMGLTVCPECGGDFLSVGILAPNMKLGKRGSPTVPLGIAWLILVGLGMLPLHSQLMKSSMRQLSTNSVTQTSGGTGPFKGVVVNARRDQVSGEPSPDALTASVVIQGANGKDLPLTVDGVTKAITDAPAASGLKGLQWDKATATKIITATGGEPDDESAAKMHSIVVEALEKTAGAAPFGAAGTLFSTSSSSSGFTTFRRGAGTAYRESLTSSGFRSASVPIVVIGGLRGAHWVTIITCATGLLLALGGLWVIVLLTRQRTGESVARSTSG